MSFNPLAGARVALGERVGVAGKFIAEYRRRRVGRKPRTFGRWRLFQAERGDCVHHALGEAGVDFAAIAFEFGRSEIERFANHDRDRTKAQSARRREARPHARRKFASARPAREFSR